MSGSRRFFLAATRRDIAGVSRLTAPAAANEPGTAAVGERAAGNEHALALFSRSPQARAAWANVLPHYLFNSTLADLRTAAAQLRIQARGTSTGPLCTRPAAW